MLNWFIAEPRALTAVAASTLGMYVLLICCARISGVRSFAEMSTFDIAVSVAVGSLIATTVATSSPPLAQGAAALVVLYVLQLGVSHVRARRRIAARTVDNRPILLMGDGGVLRRRNMVIARVTEDDLRTHLRGANVSDLAEIRAVVMEGTGTIHVLHGEHAQLDKPRPWILNNVWDSGDSKQNYM